MDQRELEHMLLNLPEKRLRILDFAGTIVLEDGTMPRELSPEELEEMGEATQEARRCPSGVRRLNGVLERAIIPSQY